MKSWLIRKKSLAMLGLYYSIDCWISHDERNQFVIERGEQFEWVLRYSLVIANYRLEGSNGQANFHDIFEFLSWYVSFCPNNLYFLLCKITSKLYFPQLLRWWHEYCTFSSELPSSLCDFFRGLMNLQRARVTIIISILDRKPWGSSPENIRIDQWQCVQKQTAQ